MVAIPRTVKGAPGRLLILLALLAGTIGVRADARRVISIIPATTEMLFAMGAGNRLIAVGNYDNYPPDVRKLPRVGALIDPNVEQILQMRPDLVVIYGTQTELKRRLDRANISYYSYVHKGLADITQTIRTLGMRVGAETAANALASRIDGQLADVRRRVAALPHPKTLLIFGREPGSLRNIDASGGVGFLHDMLDTAGGTDALADIQRQSVMMSTEMILARAPDVIIELRYTADAINSADLNVWNRLGSVPAVRNHRVITLTGEEFVVPGPRVADATKRMAGAVHPELRW